MAKAPTTSYYERPSQEDLSFMTQKEESKLLTKAKSNPFYPIGITGGLCGLGYMIYKFKNRGDLKLSLYLIHTRMLVQGTVVGIITLGVGYTMFNEHVLKKKT